MHYTKPSRKTHPPGPKQWGGRSFRISSLVWDGNLLSYSTLGVWGLAGRGLTPGRSTELALASGSFCRSLPSTNSFNPQDAAALVPGSHNDRACVMYLVELRPGKEELYRNGDELAAAIRNGDVDVHSRIYHRATSKWISITLHPQYKAIVAQKAATQLPPLERKTWTYLNAQSETLGQPDPETTADADSRKPRRGSGVYPWRRPFALSVTGLFLIFGVQLAFSGPRPPWATPRESGMNPRATRQAVTRAEKPEPSVVSLASTTTWADEDSTFDSDLPEDTAPPEKRPEPAPLPRAPKLPVKALKEGLPKPSASHEASTVEGLIARYSAAYDSARARLGSGMRVVRLNQLFAGSRLTPNGGVTETRLALAGAANFIRVYRQQEGTIEREYQESFTTLAKQHGWSPKVSRVWQTRVPLKEKASLAMLTGDLLASIDSLLGVLDAQAGAYTLRGGTIDFEDPNAAREYGALRRQIAIQVRAAQSANGAESEGAMGHLLRAIGTTQLPRET